MNYLCFDIMDLIKYGLFNEKGKRLGQDSEGQTSVDQYSNQINKFFRLQSRFNPRKFYRAWRGFQLLEWLILVTGLYDSCEIYYPRLVRGRHWKAEVRKHSLVCLAKCGKR